MAKYHGNKFHFGDILLPFFTNSLKTENKFKTQTASMSTWTGSISDCSDFSFLLLTNKFDRNVSFMNEPYVSNSYGFGNRFSK